MFLGFDNLSNGYIYTPSPIFSPTTIGLKEATFDELYVDNIEKPVDNFTNNGNKQLWKNNTLIKAEFNNNFEAGSFDATGFEVTSIRFKKKKSTDLIWYTFCEMPYNNQQTKNTFVVFDKLNENQVEYDYGITAVCKNEGNVEGYIKPIGSIKSEFNDCYIFGVNDNDYYKLSYNLTQNNKELVIPNSVVNMLSDSKYPVVLYGADTQYVKGGLQCYLIANIDKGFDIYQERAFREQVMNFLCDKKPKVLKMEDGTYMLIAITDTPQLIPSNKGLGLYQVSFKYVECGDIFDEQTLINNGFIKAYDDTI